MFDYNLFDFDRNHQMSNAKILDDAILYRATSLSHSGPDEILTGKGPYFSREFGRFHGPQQPTTYCSNNVLVCISEIIYHIYSKTLKRLMNAQPFDAILAGLSDKRCMVIFQTNEIDNIVYIDSEGAKIDFGRTIGGTMTVFPGEKYDPFNNLSNTLREQKKKGVIYPSARHSMDVCFALFDDETSSVKKLELFEILQLDIQLVPEDQDPMSEPREFNPYNEKIHPTMGYFEFSNPDKLEELKENCVINPPDLKNKGMIDFVRRNYSNYPVDAIRP